MNGRAMTMRVSLVSALYAAVDSVALAMLLPSSFLPALNAVMRLAASSQSLMLLPVPSGLLSSTMPSATKSASLPPTLGAPSTQVAETAVDHSMRTWRSASSS